jgi:hypothetical protein
MSGFAPLKVDNEKPYADRKGRVIMADIGRELKQEFVDYCKKHNTSQADMIKQMIEYCMDGDNKPEAPTGEGQNVG